MQLGDRVIHKGQHNNVGTVTQLLKGDLLIAWDAGGFERTQSGALYTVGYDPKMGDNKGVWHAPKTQAAKFSRLCSYFVVKSKERRHFYE